MREVEAIHQAARRYLIDRGADWDRVYTGLGAAGGVRTDADDGSWAYTDAALDTFPRANVLRAILEEVEQFIPADFPTPDEARQTLAAAGETARNLFTQDTDPSPAAVAAAK